MPLSAETQELLDVVLQKVQDEGYNVAGFYMSAEPPEFVHFSLPSRSRANMAQMVETWLNLLQDNDIATEVVTAPRIYQA